MVKVYLKKNAHQKNFSFPTDIDLWKSATEYFLRNPITKTWIPWDAVEKIVLLSEYGDTYVPASFDYSKCGCQVTLKEGGVITLKPSCNWEFNSRFLVLYDKEKTIKIPVSNVEEIQEQE